MASRKSLFALTFAAAAALGLYGMARADEPAKAPAAPASTETKTDEATKAPATKTQSPVMSVLFWVGSQVAPDLGTPCPGTPEGEKAWRTWFAGGSEIPLAPLRDRLVADGWTADRFVSFFQEMSKSSCCEGGEEGDDCCEGAKSSDCGKCKDGGKCEGKCPCKDKGAATTKP